MAEKLTLASMCAGGVQERIDRALAKISDNILDLNTDAKKKRVLDVKITLTPNEDDREDVSVEVQTSVKLAPEMGLSCSSIRISEVVLQPLLNIPKARSKDSLPWTIAV